AYYHYFLPIVPFAVLLAAPLAVGLVKRSPRVVAVATVSLVLIWAADITFGSDPSRLFITASQFSAIQPTVALLERTTEPGTRVLADEFEYAFLARRPSMADYFWNMDTVISARYLEYHLSRTGAVILTRLVTQPYPAGFTRYLREGGFIHIHTAATEIWLPRHAVAEKLRDQVASLQSLVVSRESGSSITEPQIDRARTND
ncbi:MAG: hypothetical protein JOZ41_02935, partial [Chloroflexi bacterium]|nr:hypothetical protein [Chloroflexota bacterium]